MRWPINDLNVVENSLMEEETRQKNEEKFNKPILMVMCKYKYAMKN